ncbi:Alpha/beta hydrolase fold-1 [Hypoxylon cercidicola]|nr:Alpha/beta hydrolase fold-1 [Hypoxylon cercidicola]
MAPVSDLAIVICHGSYHSPAPYIPLVEALKANGIEAYCPQLPTSDLSKLNVGDVTHPDFDREPPSGGYPQGEADTEVILTILRPLKRHSQSYKRNHGKARDSSVASLAFYVGAFVIPVSESIHSFLQPKDGSFVTPPFMRFHKHGEAGLGTMVEPEKFLFNGLETSEAKKWAASLAASPVLTTKLTNNAYAALPCAYLVLEGDLTLPKEYQEGMIAAQSQKTGEFSVYRCSAGHSPHLTWTQGVVGVVQSFA